MKLQGLVGLSLGAVVIAAHAGHPSEDVTLPLTVPVHIPNQHGTWIIGLEGVYSETDNSDFNYGYTSITNQNQSDTNTPRKTHILDGHNHWGFHGDIAYLFGGDGRDVKVSWTRMHEHGHDDLHTVDGFTFHAIDPFILSPNAVFSNVASTTWDLAKAHSKDDYDAIDLVFGQEMEFGEKVSLHPFGGLRYVDIDSDKKASYYYSGNNDQLLVHGETKITSNFDGIGPRAGLESEIWLGGNFSLRGWFAGALLVGSLNQSTHSYATQQNLIADTVETTIFDRKAASQIPVVPELDAHLGLHYAYNCTPQTSIGIEVGYEVSRYFNVVDTSLLSYRDAMHHHNDYAHQGPFGRVDFTIS